MNFSDNLFYVNEIIKLLEYSQKLEISVSLTGRHLSEQLAFVDTVLSNLYSESESINGSSHYEEILRSIMKSKYRFSSLLKILSGRDDTADSPVSMENDEISAMKSRHDADIEKIESYFTDKEGSKTPEDLVSQEEFRCLFGTEENESP